MTIPTINRDWVWNSEAGCVESVTVEPLEKSCSNYEPRAITPQDDTCKNCGVDYEWHD